VITDTVYRFTKLLYIEKTLGLGRVEDVDRSNHLKSKTSKIKVRVKLLQNSQTIKIIL
jgi:hypothetical protein